MDFTFIFTEDHEMCGEIIIFAKKCHIQPHKTITMVTLLHKTGKDCSFYE